MVFLVPYAYDRMPDGKPCEGVPANRLGTKARIDALKQHGWLWVLTAGYTKESPEKPSGKYRVSLASQMCSYILYSTQGSDCIIQECAWGTQSETRAVISVITKWRQSWSIRDSVEVFVSTNIGHMPRVWLCWLFLKPKGWKVHFIRAHHSFTPKECLQETAKFFSYLYRFLFRKW